jgi:peptidoglycan/xylan/chitin deacetylase (PgdA/CDA1 family)
MTAAELTKVTGEGLVEIGAHTVSHPHLASLPSHDAQAAEIYGSREALESMVGRPVRAFAYPYGTARDFGDRAVEIVRRAGFDAACTAIAGSVEPGDDPFRLRRCWVHDWDLAMFERQLEWFHLIRHA